MMDTSRISIPEGIDFLTWYGPRSHDEDKEKERELEREKEMGKVDGIAGADSKTPNRTDGVTNQNQEARRH